MSNVLLAGGCGFIGSHLADFLLSKGHKVYCADKRVDLDRDILKPLVSTGRIYGYNSTEYCKDCGTPERFRSVEKDILSGLVQSRNLSMPQKAIFLGCGGTINKYVGFLRDIEQFVLIDGVAEAIRCINDSGYLCIVVTDQSVIERGEVTVEQLTTIYDKMETLLGGERAYIDALYYCPYYPDKGHDSGSESLKFDCDCRKPKSRMIFKAARDFNIDLKQSWMISDGKCDIKAGMNAGCRTVLITSARGECCGKNTDYKYGHALVAHSLFEAVKIILLL